VQLEGLISNENTDLGYESICWILEMRKFKEGSMLLKSVSLLHMQHVFNRVNYGRGSN